MQEPAIETHELRKEFGEKVAVEGLTLTMNKGEVFGFLGPNGAGKTTSIKMMLGLTAPTAGEAFILGKPIGDRLTRQRLGYLPEHFRFYHWLKAKEFLTLHGSLYGKTNGSRRYNISELLERVGLAGQEETQLQAFSKGMTQRIGLAQAMMHNPDIIFLDEPTSGLDPMGRRLVRDVIAELRDNGTAVFVNSHILSEIEKTCSRVAFIRSGRVIETYNLSDFEEGQVNLILRLGDPTLEAIQLLETHSEDCYQTDDQRFHLTLANEGMTPQLANALTAGGHAIYELIPQKMSLEDRFVRIVGGDA